MKFLKALFGATAEKYEDKADELRLDFEYKDAAFYYQQALDALGDAEGEASERVGKKLREVRRKAFSQFLEDGTEYLRTNDLRRAEEVLEIAGNFADDQAARDEVDRLHDELEQMSRAAAPAPPVDDPDEVTGTEAELFELALSGYSPADRERAVELGDRFRLAYEDCQEESWERAMDKADALLLDHPGEALVLELGGLAAEHADELDRAIAYLERVKPAGEPRPGAVLSLASLYRKQERAAEARNVISAAAASIPVHRDLDEAWVELHLEHALALADGGHYDSSVSTLVSLLDVVNADRGFIFFNLGGILERAGREEDARAALEHAMDASPRKSLYRERMADFLLKRGVEMDEALHLLVEANQLETTSGGSMLGGGGTKAIQSPNRARYLYKMARVYFLKGDDLEAERTVTTALAISRDAGVTEALEGLRRELREVRQGQ